MSKPPPPPALAAELSPLPTKSLAEAAEWFASHEVDMTERFIREATDSHRLRCTIIAGKRRYSTQNLYDWLTGLPSNTRRGPHPNERKTHASQR